MAVGSLKMKLAVEGQLSSTCEEDIVGISFN